MSDNTRNNPFRHLAERLSARNDNPDASKPGSNTSVSDKLVPGIVRKPDNTKAAPPDKKHAAAAPFTDDGEDAALFLDAVSHIQPLRRKENKTRSTDGHSLADSLRALKERPTRSVPADKSRAVPVAAKPAPPANESEAEHFGTAMHQPLSSPALGTSGDSGRPNLADSLKTPEKNSPAPDEENELFSKAMAGTRPLNDKGRDLAPAANRKSLPPAVDPARALQEILEGRLEFALHHTDEYMEGFVVGLDPLVLARLRAGRYSPEKHLDLHGMNSRQAFDALTYFLKDAYQRNMRCVVVVTGRGRNSPDGVGVLRPSLQNWLSRDPFKRVVLAFCTAKAGDGGPGAAYVLLRKYKKSRGKIIWERGPTDDDFPDL